MSDDTSYGQWLAVGNYGATTFVDNSCPHCGMWHGKACPRIKAIEYHPNGTVKRIEYNAIAAPVEPGEGQ